MLRSNSKSLGGIHVDSPEEEKEMLRWEGFAEKVGIMYLNGRNTYPDQVSGCCLAYYRYYAFRSC